jgi:uncharacterized ubiquitin-like protein YukD
MQFQESITFKNYIYSCQLLRIPRVTSEINLIKLVRKSSNIVHYEQQGTSIVKVPNDLKNVTESG